MPRRVTEFLTEAPGWMLLGLLVYAPWAYGCTRAWTIGVLVDAMYATLGVWLLGCMVRRTRPIIPLGLAICGGLLLLQGCWMILNARYFYDRTNYVFQRVPCLWQAGPGALDTVDAIPAMVRIAALLGIIGMASDLSQRPQWRTLLWWTVGLTGLSIVLFGLVERITDAEMIFWEERSIPHPFFATYYYHANAGAFVNLVLPLIFGLVLIASRKHDDNLGRAIWIPALLVGLAGAVAAASKGALAILVVMVIILAMWRSRSFGRWWQHLPSHAARVGVVMGALVGVVAIVAMGWSSMLSRFMDEDWVSNSAAVRLMAYQACVSMFPDSGCWGFGPGNFMIAFPHYTARFGSALAGIWRFAHNDYLQTAIEWGWFGAALWAILYFGGVFRGWRSYADRENLLASGDRILLFTVATALIGIVLHSLVDFPLQIASLQLYAAVYLGLQWGSSTWGFGSATAEPPRPTERPGRATRIARSARVAATHYP